MSAVLQSWQELSDILRGVPQVMWQGMEQGLGKGVAGKEGSRCWRCVRGSGGPVNDCSVKTHTVFSSKGGAALSFGQSGVQDIGLLVGVIVTGPYLEYWPTWLCCSLIGCEKSKLEGNSFLSRDVVLDGARLWRGRVSGWSKVDLAFLGEE